MERPLSLTINLIKIISPIKSHTMFKNLKKTFSIFLLTSIAVISMTSFVAAASAAEITSVDDVTAIEAETVQSVMTISDEVDVYFFWGDGCPHCEKEKAFLEDLKDEYDEVNVFDYEVWYDDENRALLEQMAGALGVQISGVPFTIIGDDYISGYLSDETTGAAIEALVVAKLGGDETGGSDFMGIVTVPFIGELNVEKFSLPVITFILGALDGFNPCAMWTLIFLITLLIGMEDKRRMWILGGAFIVASAFIYFLFMAAWLNLILFLGFIVWVRIIIGLIALAGGGYNLKEYVTNKDGSCKVTGSEKRQKTFARLKALTHEKNFWLALAGIILLAFAVNLVELVCSAGLPAVYTQVLALNDLATWQYYAYLLFYIFIFMLDDLLVFFVAMATLQITGLTTKYTRWSHLIGGILMLILGALLIFKPEWLFFG